MNEKEFQSILELHTLSTRLKNTLRKGWENWKVEGVRVESVAEHIFSTCMLAVGMLSVQKTELDVNKIITMIMLHETEEILIGDITMFDYEDLKTKKERGRMAVLSIFKDFPNSEHFVNIITEFEERITPEAKFAKQCDKMEADLQARIYEGHYNIDKVEDRFFKDERTINSINNGYNTVSEQFLQNDMHIYTGEFKDFANYLQELEKKEKVNYNRMENRF